MLVKSSFDSSTETSLLKVSEYQDPFAAYDWASLAKTYQMIHKFPEESQVSFFEAVPVPDAMNLDESKHPKLQVSCSEESVMQKISEKPLTSLVYSRRKRGVKPGGTTEDNLGKNKKQDHSLDDSIFPVQNPGKGTKRKNRFNDCLVYCRKKKRGNSSCNISEEISVGGDGLDAFFSAHDCGETKTRGNRLDNCLVYIRKKGGVKSNSCNFTQHDSEGTKKSRYQDDSEGTKKSHYQDVSSAYSQKGQIVKADGSFSIPNAGEIKNNCHQPVYNQGKQLMKSNSSFTESHIAETKRNGDTSDIFLTYSRRKRKSGGARVNGILVYSRKNPKVKSRCDFTGHDTRESRKNGDQLSNVSSHALSVPEKHGEQMRNAVELVTTVTCSSDGNDSCSSLKSSSELASSASKSGEDEATDCYSSDSGVSGTDTDGSSSPFRPCKHCDKPGTVEKMLICDKCEESYHTSCCSFQMKEVEEIDDWLCPSCLKKKSSKTKTKGRISRERKWRVTEPFVIGIRIGKMFQADVPDWSGPTMSDTSFIGEPLEIDQSEYMHDIRKAKNGKKPRSTVNWLQCREEDVNGDICGKWRRAPRSEVQTKDWECFCCVFWDPSRADCAVPQELETSEILKQLKYIKMLRPRSDAKTKKLGPKGRSRSHNKGKS